MTQSDFDKYLENSAFLKQIIAESREGTAQAIANAVLCTCDNKAQAQQVLQRLVQTNEIRKKLPQSYANTLTEQVCLAMATLTQ